MSLKGQDLPVQVTHIPGITRVSYTPDPSHDKYVPSVFTFASRLITAGEDQLVRLLPSEADDTDVAPMVIEDAMEAITWVDVNQKYLVTASADGAVRLYQHTSRSDDPRLPTQLVHIVRREALPVRCAALERAAESPRVAVCSDELLVRVVNAADPRSITLLTGHTRGVRAATWSPGLPLLVTCGSDGDLRVWDMSGPDGNCVKVLSGILPGLRAESELSSAPTWHPNGRIMAVPLKTQEIGLLHTPTSMGELQRPESWRTIATLGPSSDTLTAELRAPSGHVSALAFSPNGRYLAAATEDMQVTIWAMDSRRVIRAHASESLVTGLSWHPAKDVLAWTDMQGQLIRWESVLGSTLPSPWEDAPVDAMQRDSESSWRQPGDHDATTHGNFDDLFDDELLDNHEAPAVELGDRRHESIRSSRVSESALRQPKVQPGSTPVVSQRRYLALTTLGALTSVDQDTHQTVVFDSFDTSARRNFRFTDHYGYTMASMAPQGILFACDAEDDSPSAVFFRPFDDTPGLQMEWSVHFPTGETVEAVALGGIPNLGSYADVMSDTLGVVDEARTSAATAIVATSRGFLRFFGPSGMQRYIWALGRPVVSMAAGPHSVVIVYESAALHAAHVQLEYMVIELLQFTIMQQGVVPLPPGATLTWVGFNELGCPAFFDSEGLLYVLDRSWRPGQGRWVPALDTSVALLPASSDVDMEARTETPKARCWPLGVTSTHLLGVLLPMSQRYPLATGPRPVMQELELSFCVVQRDSPSAPLEEMALRRALLADAVRDSRAAIHTDVSPARLPGPDGDPAAIALEADKALLQLVQVACKADRYARAMDASRALHSEATLDAALKIADFFHLPSLAERLEQVRAPLAEKKQFEMDIVNRACGIDALLRNVARVPVPVPQAGGPPEAASPVKTLAREDLQRDGFDARAKRLTGSSTLAREGVAHKQAPDHIPTPPPASALPSEWSSLPPTHAGSEPTPTPPPPAPSGRANPFARTHSVAKERQLQKSQSFFDRVEAPGKRKSDEDGAGSDRTEKRNTSRQSTLANFAFEPPVPPGNTGSPP